MVGILQEWGTFSVRDHTRAYPFVSDVLLFDKLVIPRCPTPDGPPDNWPAAWNPRRLEQCLDVLGGVAVAVEWNEERRQQFRARARAAEGGVEADAQEAGAKDDPSATRDYDPFYDTSLSLYQDVMGAGPPGAHITPIAAYPSQAAFSRDYRNLQPVQPMAPDPASVVEIPAGQLGSLVGHALLTPAIAEDVPPRTEVGLLEPERTMLLRALDLANKPTFRAQREHFRESQRALLRALQPPDGVIQGDTVRLAVKCMTKQLRAYNDLVATEMQQHDVEVRGKFAFKLAEVGAALSLSIAGMATLEPMMAGASLAAAAIPIVSFVRYERPAFRPSRLPDEPIAMFVTASSTVFPARGAAQR